MLNSPLTVDETSTNKERFGVYCRFRTTRVLRIEPETVFSARLKEARIAAGLSQERLGVVAGIEEASASARMNQYERGKH
jgi:DNA-binding XRE family transcriptional regulator